MSKCIILTGPSGVGKDTIIRAVAARTDAIIGVSHTTRAMRPGEIDGYSYHFVDELTFVSMIGADAFIEWDHHFDVLYGFTWAKWREAQRNDRDLLVILDPNGTKRMLAELPDAVTIFLMPESRGQLFKQMAARGDTLASIERRLDRAAWEMGQGVWYQHVIANPPDRPFVAVDAISALVLA